MPRAECTKDSPGEELYGHYIIAVPYLATIASNIPACLHGKYTLTHL